MEHCFWQRNLSGVPEGEEGHRVPLTHNCAMLPLDDQYFCNASVALLGVRYVGNFSLLSGH